MGRYDPARLGGYMSHNAITYSGHQAGVYHSSHAFEGGNEKNGYVGYYPDAYNRKIIVQRSTSLELWDMDGDGYIADIPSNTSWDIHKSVAIHAHNDAESFFVASPTGKSAIVEYDGTVTEEFAARPTTVVVANGETINLSYFTNYAPEIAFDYSFDLNHPQSLAYLYNGNAFYTRITVDINSVTQTNVGIFYEHRNRNRLYSKTIANVNAFLATTQNLLPQDYGAHQKLQTQNSITTTTTLGKKYIATVNLYDKATDPTYSVRDATTWAAVYTESKKAGSTSSFNQQNLYWSTTAFNVITFFNDFGLYFRLGSIWKLPHGVGDQTKGTRVFEGRSGSTEHAHIGSDYNYYRIYTITQWTGFANKNGVYFEVTHPFLLTKYFINGGFVWMDTFDGTNYKIIKINLQTNVSKTVVTI